MIVSEYGVIQALIEANGSPLPPNLARLVAHPGAFDDLIVREVAEIVQSKKRRGQPLEASEIKAELQNGDHQEESLAWLDFSGPPLACAEVDAEQVWMKYSQRRTAELIDELQRDIVKAPGERQIHLANFKVQIDLLDLPPAWQTVRLADLRAPSTSDGRELLKDRFVCRGGSWLLVGPTGAGKSSFAMQAGILWSVERHCFGIRSAFALRVLYVQAENDEGDLYEMRNGIYEGLELTKEEVRSAGSNFEILSVNDSIGDDFLEKVIPPAIEAFRPDLLILDPLLAFAGDDISQQHVIGKFVRAGLGKVVSRANCGLLVVHHPPKPKQEKGESKAGEDSYYGAGSADLANWARAVAVIKPAEHHGIYKLRIPKRGRRVGWVEEDGQTPSIERTIAHGKGGLIYWREAEQGETFQRVIPSTAKPDLLSLVPPERPIDKAALIFKAKEEKGIGRSRAFGIIEELITDGRLFEWRIARPRTNPKIALARNPQPA